ncbi:uncharacterized protein ACNLHF_004685, partial [Anomaloglossus baeobatrachus]
PGSTEQPHVYCAAVSLDAGVGKHQANSKKEGPYNIGSSQWRSSIEENSPDCPVKDGYGQGQDGGEDITPHPRDPLPAYWRDQNLEMLHHWRHHGHGSTSVRSQATFRPKTQRPTVENVAL